MKGAGGPGSLSAPAGGQLRALRGQLLCPAGHAPHRMRHRSWPTRIQAYKVEIRHEGGTDMLEVGDGDSILDAAIDAGLAMSHDCKMGVCMTCPARLVDGDVDQSAGMLSEDVKAKGYALLCVSYPQGDCTIQTIEEDELLEHVLHGDG